MRLRAFVAGGAASAATLSGNNNGVGGTANTSFGTVVDFVNMVGNNGSTEPAKRFFKYARPFRWSTSVQVVPALLPARSSTPATDGGFTSGHSAEAMRNALAMAYVVPERFQEIVSRGLEDIKQFRQMDSKTPGHPEYRMTTGVETTTGPLGQGCANSVGMAMAERWLGEHFNKPEG